MTFLRSLTTFLSFGFPTYPSKATTDFNSQQYSLVVQSPAALVSLLALTKGLRAAKEVHGVKTSTLPVSIAYSWPAPQEGLGCVGAEKEALAGCPQ